MSERCENAKEEPSQENAPKVIEWEEWHHTCADGCCDRWGIEVWVDGKSIGSREFGDAGSILELFLESEGRDCVVRKVIR